jgi:hypothetical protein
MDDDTPVRIETEATIFAGSLLLAKFGWVFVQVTQKKIIFCSPDGGKKLNKLGLDLDLMGTNNASYFLLLGRPSARSFNSDRTQNSPWHGVDGRRLDVCFHLCIRWR